MNIDVTGCRLVLSSFASAIYFTQMTPMPPRISDSRCYAKIPGVYIPFAWNRPTATRKPWPSRASPPCRRRVRIRPGERDEFRDWSTRTLLFWWNDRIHDRVTTPNGGLCGEDPSIQLISGWCNTIIHPDCFGLFQLICLHCQ